MTNCRTDKEGERMINYEKVVLEMDFHNFVSMMILNCDGCPYYDCPLRASSVSGDECEEVLTEWLEQEVSE